MLLQLEDESLRGLRSLLVSTLLLLADLSGLKDGVKTANLLPL